jgi:two-component system response regulator MprA
MKRILLVDDDPDILATLRCALEAQGYGVETARDGREAMARVRSASPDLLVLDVMLPGMNGYETARWLKAEMRDGRVTPFKILMLTARRVASSARQEFLATWSGADAQLWKPFDLEVLLHQVHVLLAAAPAEVEA